MYAGSIYARPLPAAASAKWSAAAPAPLTPHEPLAPLAPLPTSPPRPQTAAAASAGPARRELFSGASTACGPPKPASARALFGSGGGPGSSCSSWTDAPWPGAAAAPTARKSYSAMPGPAPAPPRPPTLRERLAALAAFSLRVESVDISDRRRRVYRLAVSQCGRAWTLRKSEKALFALVARLQAAGACASPPPRQRQTFVYGKELERVRYEVEAFLADTLGEPETLARNDVQRFLWAPYDSSLGPVSECDCAPCGASDSDVDLDEPEPSPPMSPIGSPVQPRAP